MVSFMPRLLYPYQSTLLECLVSFLVSFILTKSPLQSGQLHASSALYLPKLPFRVVSLMPRLLYP